MAATNDTIDGLLAEFRGYLAGLPASYHFTVSCRDIRLMLDRLEAAHKRERGDCAKLREALAPFPSLCEWLVVNASKLGIPDMVAKLRERGDKARAALAAPPRNCDKVKTSWDVLKEWHEGLDTANDVVRLLDWLFAPATEKEGGAK